MYQAYDAPVSSRAVNPITASSVRRGVRESDMCLWKIYIYNSMKMKMDQESGQIMYKYT